MKGIRILTNTKRIGRTIEFLNIRVQFTPLWFMEMESNFIKN